MPDFLTALGLGPSAPNGVDFSTLGYGGLVADARRAIKSDEPATLRRQSLMEKLAETWPARLARSVYGAVTLPGDVYAGRTDPNSDEGIGRAADLAGLVMGGTYGAAPAGAVGSSGGKVGIRAYHGSPYDFERFDLSRIGTGEGNQAYGHGLYFAENEATAKAYKQALAGKSLPIREIVEKYLPGEAVTQGDLGKIYSAALNGDKSPDAAAKSVQMMLRHLRDDGISFVGPPGERGQKLSAAIAELRDQGRGHMYEVNINARPEQFLDWDKPLMEQEPGVNSAMRRLGYSQAMTPDGPALLGPEVRRTFNNPLYLNDTAKTAADVSDAFLQAGIPGIRYLDQVSRGAGEGSRNYVVFNDKLIDILRKYGIFGAAPIPALQAADQAQPAQ